MIIHASPDLLPMELLRDVNQALAELLGCLAPPDRMLHLSRALARAASRMGEKNAVLFCHRIINRQTDDLTLEALAAELLPGETYFYRERPSMEALQRDVLPSLLQARQGERKLNIWSAACSTGEEPLTLAILVRTMLADHAGWTVSIQASDLQPRLLAIARLGLYRDWSFRDCPGWFKERHFARDGPGAWKVSSELLAMVDYRQFNLVRDPFPPSVYPAGGFDLIVCRNVMIYMNPASITPLLSRLCDCLAERGWLLVAAVEAPYVSCDLFERVQIGEAMFFRKRPAAAIPSCDVPAESQIPNPMPTVLFEKPAPMHSRPRESEAVNEHDRDEKKGLASITRTHRAAKSQAEHYRAQAATCLAHGDFSMARELLRRALYLDRHNVMALVLQGQVLQRGDQNEQARRSYINALKLLDRLPPSQELEHDRHLTVAQMAAKVREALNRLGKR